MFSVFDNKFDSSNTSCGKVSDEIPPKALQEQTKNSAITPAIQNKFEFDSKIPFKCKHNVYITGIGVTRAVHLLLCNYISTASCGKVSDEISFS
jgi:hypothetical protein